MAGYSRIRIFDPNGFELAEIDAATVRSWSLNNTGRCQFTYPLYSGSGGFSPQATAQNFNFGNFILIEHTPSQNADGTFNGTLPPWVGIIVANPRDWEYGKITVTAYSAEQVLFYRPMPITTITGTPGMLFTYFVGMANALGGFPIQFGVLETSGTSMQYATSVSALEEIQTLCSSTGFDFDVTPKVQSNRLSLYANFYKTKGIDVGQVLTPRNLEAASPLYTEQGQFYNYAVGFSDASTGGTRVSAVASNPADIAVHGLLGTSVVFVGATNISQAAVYNLTRSFLNLNGAPTRTFAPTVLDVGNAFSYMNTGNIWNVETDVVGFTNGTVGLKGKIRVRVMEYDDLRNFVRFSGSFS